jgi:hypothetical protein
MFAWSRASSRQAEPSLLPIIEGLGSQQVSRLKRLKIIYRLIQSSLLFILTLLKL